MINATLGDKSSFGMWCLIVDIDSHEPQILKITHAQWLNLKNQGLPVQG